MNIWCISKYTSPPKYSKMPTRLFNYCREWVKMGHHVTYITSDANHLADYPATDKVYNKEVIEDIEVYWLKTKKYTKTASAERILSWLDFERRLFGLNTKDMKKPDIVIVSSLSILSIGYGYYLKKKYGAFLVFEIRDIWPLMMVEGANFNKHHPLVLFIGAVEKFGYQFSDLIVGTMPRLDLHIEEILGHRKFNFYCAPFGVMELSKADEKINLKEELFEHVFPKDKIIIGYAGSMGISNALEPFINTIQQVEKTIPNLYFVLIGSGDLRESFQEQLKSSENVKFLPRIPQNQVQNFLSNCDAVFLSTTNSKLWNYGQSLNKVIEYMTAGKPILALYYGYQSMINEAKCGFFITPESDQSAETAIEATLVEISNMSKNELREIGQRGKMWITKNRRYSILAKQYLTKIQNLMPEK